MKLKTNRDQLVEFALQCSPIPPMAYGWEVSRSGEGKFTPSVGGITYNVKIGDSVYFHNGDHLEPGVSCFAGGFNDRRTANPNLSLNAYSCIGNEATLINGAAKGKKGVVTGHHGGVEHVILDFPDSVMQQLTYDDKILIRGVGQGLKLVDYPEVSVMNIDPELLAKIPVQAKKGLLEFPVAAFVPAQLMGSGLGHNDTFKGDYDIQSGDETTLKIYNLQDLRFGDFVAIMDHESAYGWSFKMGAVSIAVVVHGNSYLAGHGPGVQTILTCTTGQLKPVIAKNANIGTYLKVGRFK